MKTFLFRTLIIVWFVFAGIFILPFGVIFKRLSYWALRSLSHGILFICKIFGIKYVVHGTPRAGAIIASKHMSVMDNAILAVTYPKVFFIMKRELMWIPIYGWLFWRMGFIPVNRKRGATNMAKLADRAKREIESGKTMIIFPEGTRVKPGAGVKLRRGLLFVAEATGLPIQPIGLDTGLYLPKSGTIKSGTAQVYLLDTLPATATLDEIAAVIDKHSA